jgi:hypothetical protein
VFAPGTTVRLRLSTFLGLDDRPGVLPGLGPVPAHIARTAARARGAATWQVLVHAPDGRLEHLLTLRAPPSATRDPRHRRETVQLTAPAELIHALGLQAAGPESDLDALCVLAAVRRVLLGEPTTTWLRHAHEALRRSETADPEDRPATTTRERHRRHPGAALDRWVRARDQTCITPGCTQDAQTCDLDHTRDWLCGGPTQADDLEALCRHHHRAKHEGGWTYHQTSPGRFDITDPTGTHHHVQSRVTHPLPQPVTPGHGIDPISPPPRPAPDWTPRRTRDGRLTERAQTTAERLTRHARTRQTRAHRGTPPSRYDHDPDF